MVRRSSHLVIPRRGAGGRSRVLVASLLLLVVLPATSYASPGRAAHVVSVTKLPSPPTSVTATAGSQVAVVRWLAPTPVVASAPILGYVVVSTPGSKFCTTTKLLTCAVTGLLNGTTYIFHVSARNLKGSSPYSTPSEPVTPLLMAPPPAPTHVTASAGNAVATVSWLASSKVGIPPTASYTATTTPGAVSCTTTALSCSLAGLVNGSSYVVRVTAKNVVGNSAASLPSLAFTPTGSTVPSAPLGLSATADDTSITFTWLDPVSTGGSAITSFRVASDVSHPLATCSTTTHSCTVSNLTMGVTLPFTVSALNALGRGAASVVLAVAPTHAPKVYAGGSDGYLYALNAASGLRLWSVFTGGKITSAPLLAGGAVYVGSASNNFYKFNSLNGSQIWVYNAASPVTSPSTLAAGVLYFADQAGTVHGVSDATGASVLSCHVGGQIVSQPLIVGSSVVVASSTGQVSACSLSRNNQVLWQSAAYGAMWGQLLFSGTSIYVGSDDGNVYALNALSGTKLWARFLGGHVESGLTSSGTTLFAGSTTGHLFALRLATGELVWSRVIGAQIFSTPLVEGSNVVVGDDSGGLSALDAASGAGVWASAIGAQVEGALGRNADLTYAGSGTTNTLVAVASATGATLWTSSLTGSVWGGVACG